MELKDTAKDYNGVFGFNVLPLKDKRPAMASWEKWQTELQTSEDVNRMGWVSATGLGGVSGINNLRVIDVDYAEDNELLGKLLSVLGLPKDYSWSVLSGSKKGYHIWFLMEESEEVLKVLGGSKAVYKSYPKNKGVCDHFEIRWKNCQTALPPSLHTSGNKYKFIFGNPFEAPQTISLKKLKMFLEKFVRTEAKREAETKQPCFGISTKLNDHSAQQPQRRKDAKDIKDIDKKELDRAIEVLAEKLPNHSYDEWLKLGFALASVGEDGREFFLKLSLGNPNYSDSEEKLNAKFDGLLKDYNGEITLGSLFSIASGYGYKRLEPMFWYGREKVMINQTKFLAFLKFHGFGKISIGNEYLFVRVVNNVVSEVTKYQIKDFVMRYVANLPYKINENITRTNLKSALITDRNKLFGETYLEFLETLELNFKKDKRKKAFKYYNNCYVVISKDDVVEKNYSELNGEVWSKQILKRNYYKSDSDTDFAKFLHNVCRGNKERVNALFSAIGYLQHGYKDSSNSKAVCFLDERFSDSAYGRSGKGLVGRALSKMCSLANVDGRNFKFGKSFAFQSVSLDTEVIFFDDVNQKFEFEKLFSIITDGINVEKKNKDEFYIGFEDSPKILITTNYSLRGVDDSTLDRQFVVEFSDYYNKNHCPIDEFGKNFFENWNEAEWNSYDNFMLSCVQLFLREGLMEYDHVNLLQKQLIDSTSSEFVEFMQDVEPGKEYEKRELFNKFKEEYPDYANMKQNTFTGWIKRYANLKELKYSERKSGAKKIFILGDTSVVSSTFGQTEVEELLL